jgi:hypothetical protein
VTDPADDPVAQYKEILDTTRQAALKLSERERKRTVELIAEIREADKAIKAATEKEIKVKQEIGEWWREVAARMAGLGWITPGRIPEPDPAADPALLDEYMGTIDPKTNAFTAALRRAAWPRRSA